MCHSGRVRLQAVELFRIRVPLKRPFRAAHGVTTHKESVVLRAHTDEGLGWGECAAELVPSYSAEFVDSALLVLRDHLLPSLMASAWASYEELDGRLDTVRGHPMAKAAIETALLDAHLRERKKGLAAYLGATRRSVPVGVVVDMDDAVDEVVRIVETRVAEGYRRIKLKIEPGRDVAVVEAVRAAIGPAIDLWVDANGSYQPTDRALRTLDTFGLGLIEQPLAAGDWAGHGALARELHTPVCLDESVRSTADLAVARQFGAADVVNVKPSCVGGVRAARALVDACAQTGIGAWVGGMLDLGINRAVNLAVAALDGCTRPGDISATGRYFDRDITAPFVLAADGSLTVPTGDGIGVDVDVEAVASCAVAQFTLR